MWTLVGYGPGLPAGSVYAGRWLISHHQRVRSVTTDCRAHRPRRELQHTGAAHTSAPVAARPSLVRPSAPARGSSTTTGGCPPPPARRRHKHLPQAPGACGRVTWCLRRRGSSGTRGYYKHHGCPRVPDEPARRGPMSHVATSTTVTRCTRGYPWVPVGTRGACGDEHDELDPYQPTRQRRRAAGGDGRWSMTGGGR